MNYVKRHTKFFLLLTRVFIVSDVGIWFVISLVNPAATSALIHNFVFGWAIEWVFFIGEIVGLLIYYNRFDNLIVIGGIFYLQSAPQNILNNLFLYNREATPLPI